jgi:uncharacterized protein with HEPN domain
MEDKEILESINLIGERINKIKKADKDKDKNILTKDYYYDVLKLNLIEIGEESKRINDILLEKKGDWDDNVSEAYNFRISLTHYYKKTNSQIIERFRKEKFPNFIEKIEKLKIEFKKIKNKENLKKEED